MDEGLTLGDADREGLHLALCKALDEAPVRGAKVRVAEKLTGLLGKPVTKGQYGNVVNGRERNPALTVLRWCLAARIEVTVHPDDGWRFTPLK